MLERASIQNHIWGVEPQQMLEKAIEVRRKGFYRRKYAEIASSSPVTPQIEKILADFIVK